MDNGRPRLSNNMAVIACSLGGLEAVISLEVTMRHRP